MAGMLHVYLCAHELVNVSSVEEFDCAATRGGSSRAADASLRKGGRFDLCTRKEQEGIRVCREGTSTGGAVIDEKVREWLFTLLLKARLGQPDLAAADETEIALHSASEGALVVNRTHSGAAAAP